MGFCPKLIVSTSLLITGYCLLGKAEPFPPEALTNATTWIDPLFAEEFEPYETRSEISHRSWPEATAIFGITPHTITAKFVGDDIQSLNLLFLDSGTHFGYIPREQADANEKANKDNFQKHFEAVKTKVLAGMNLIGKTNNRTESIGQERLLRQSVLHYKTGDLFARLHAIDEQLIKVTFFKSSQQARSWVSEELLRQPSRVRAAPFQQNVNRADNGDVTLPDVPLLPQGDRAYCGVSALAMTMQFVGLNIDTEDLAAAAGIRYGSTKGSNIRDVYQAAAEEAGMRMSRTTRFDFSKAKQAIDAGLPVLVWRRWSQERDFIHTTFARRFANDPTITLPEPNADDQAMWPDKKAYAHATVVTGYNEKRREVIFTESWSERERKRRMRIEELEATCYYAFFLRM